MFYSVTVLEGEAESVCLLDLPLDAGNITKIVDVGSVLWRHAWVLTDVVSIQNKKKIRHIIVLFVEQKNSFVIEKKMIYMFSVDCCNIPERR
jgi:hypothetical protein